MKYKLRGTKFLAMFITLVLTVGCMGEVSYAAEPESKQENLSATVSEGNLVTVDLSDSLLQNGGLLKEDEVEEQDGYGEETLPKYLAVDKSTYYSVEKLLKSTYDSFSKECSLEKYQLTGDEVSAIVREVLNTNPRYFYVNGAFSYRTWEGYVTTLRPMYTYQLEQAVPMLQAYDAAVLQAVRGASSDWSDLEKALYINDYITRNCEYDTTYSNYTAYDVFVNKSAVCQGYSLAYMELANQLGLSAEIVSSFSLNHAWNMIKVNGKYYQEDVTWNDPTNDHLGRARHQYFMKSTDYFRTEGNHFVEDDWVVSGGLSWTAANSTAYDGYFWNGTDVGFEYIDGYWYGFDGVERIVKYDCDGSSLQEVEEVLQIDDVWWVTGGYGYYGSKYLGLGQFDGKLYYSDTDTIYCYNLNTKNTKEIYSLSGTEKSVGSIYGIHVTAAGEVYYYLAPSMSRMGGIYLADVLKKAEPETEPERYIIVYILNGGTNNSKNPKSYMVKDTFVLKSPTKKNYNFGGWYTDAEYTKPITRISQKTTGNLVLYAKWDEKVYKIKFNGNGATGGSMGSLTNLKHDNSYMLTSNAYKRKGYTFAGWNTKADGSGKNYKDMAIVQDLTSTITLYAQWKKDTYKITYKINNGKNSKSNPSGYTVTSKTITLKQPTRTGYTFAGWYSDSKLKKKVATIAEGSTGNKTFYAKWTPNKYVIKYDKNGAASGKMNPMKNRKYGTKYTLSKNLFKRKGYTFTGWNTKKNGNGKSYRNKASVKNLVSQNGSSITLYAQWKKESYKITYKLNGGKNKSSNPKKYDITTKTFELKNPTRKGYVFKGWYKDKKFKKKVTQITKGSTGNVTLYAKWVKK